MKKNFLSAFILFFYTVFNFGYSQTLIKELYSDNFPSTDSTFLNTGRFREIIFFDGEWKVYSPSDFNNKSKVQLPSTFEGTDVIVYEKEIVFSEYLLNTKKLELNFLGLNYSAEISVNGLVIFKHSGGAFPFSVSLPKDILKANSKNTLSIKVNNKLDSQNTIPLKQRVLFPKSLGGIFRSVYLVASPLFSIEHFLYDYKINKNSNLKLSLNISIDNSIPNNSDSLNNKYELRTIILDKANLIFESKVPLNFSNKKNLLLKNDLTLQIPSLWHPDNPSKYLIQAQLFLNDQLVDEYSRTASFFNLEQSGDSLLLNDRSFSFKGTTYYFSNRENGQMLKYDQIKNDLKMIKDMGFNSVYFAKAEPHPYALKVCEDLGLLAIIEIPLNSMPENFAEKPNFSERTKIFLNNFITAYKPYSAVALIGLGSSYLGNSAAHKKFLESIIDYLNVRSDKLSFASFFTPPTEIISNLDFYGVEILEVASSDYQDNLRKVLSTIGKSKVLISEVAYPNFNKTSSGYLIPYSYEAQAKFYEDVIDFVNLEKINGLFFNSMFDYRGDYPSISFGFNENNLYQIGIWNEDKNLKQLGYKVIYSKLNNLEKVTIPIGNKKDDFPLLFILTGLSLAVLMGFIINSNRKFREDATRALLRPYNFYADIRDQRILSGFHSHFLLFILAGSASLLFTNLLYTWKSSLLFEKIVISTGSENLIGFMSSLAWQPTNSLIWIFILWLISFIMLTIIIKIMSLFIKTRVLYSSIFFMLTWAFLPLALLIPVELILYKVLKSGIADIYIYVLLMIFVLWVLQRIIKGTFVIFDIKPSVAYFYSFLILALTFGGFILYFHLSNSFLFYFINTLKQFSIL